MEGRDKLEEINSNECVTCNICDKFRGDEGCVGSGQCLHGTKPQQSHMKSVE